MRKLTLGAIALAAGTVIGSPASYADLFGEIFLPTGSAARIAAVTAAASNATRANVAAIPDGPNGTFISTAFDYTAPVGGAFTVGAFLNNDSPGGSIAAASLTNTVFRFSGDAIANPNGTGTGTITHDDGIELWRGGTTTSGGTLVVSDPLPQSVDVTPIAFVGSQFITLTYGECCGAPAQLFSTIDNAVPEPASLALLGTALVGLVPVLRRRRKTV